jgi:tight adherence protein C
MDTAVLISILTAAAILLFGAGLFYYINDLRARRKLLQRVQESEETGFREIIPDLVAPKNAIKDFFMKIVTPLGHRTKPKNAEEVSFVRRRLLNAGYRGQNTMVTFFGTKVLLAVVLPVSFFLFKLVFLKPIAQSSFILLCIFFALIGFYLPNAWLRFKIGQRKEKITEGFPDALDLLVVCVEAGMGLDSAIRRVGDETKLSSPILSDELHLLNLELMAGKPRQSALRNLAIRTGLEDVSSFVTLLIQTDKFGTSIGTALRIHSDGMRTKRYQKAEEQAGKLPVKLVFPLILCIFPTLFVALIGPAVIRIIRVLFPTVVGQ